MISIVIRAKNEEAYITEVLEAIFAQDDLEEFEILVIDSGSTDRTKQLVQNYPVRLEEIHPDRFSFGSALNLGVALAQGEIVVYLSAHCTPTTHDWLRKLVDPLRRNDRLVATYGRQQPRKGVNPFEEPALLNSFPADYLQAPRALFSNANCAIRRMVLLNHPFDESLTSSEDLVWRMNFDSEQIFYVPDASVYHSHGINLRYWAHRFEEDGFATIEMQRRYGIINPYFERADTFSKAARGFFLGCMRLPLFFVFEGYFRFIPFVPIFEFVRACSTARGLRRGMMSTPATTDAAAGVRVN
jgi:glycosyltransferase involved in cell wall biosynthesis